ncbi:hypothetical protein [uncultured Aquimarina sp.]|uniref:hypothetical protein n=1 Tax=uncultured Aquimarina sp. TaxID=575652 RepID=UPI0026284BEE|nr:hypothetical protein [uncultured Aquimarina sp.]
MTKKILKSIIFLTTLTSLSQTRYLDKVTENVSIKNNVIFSKNIPTIETFNLFGNHIANEKSYGKKTCNSKDGYLYSE